MIHYELGGLWSRPIGANDHDGGYWLVGEDWRALTNVLDLALRSIGTELLCTQSRKKKLFPVYGQCKQKQVGV